MGQVLVIEDKDTLRAMLQRLLCADHLVDTAADGEAALRMLGASSYDLVLCDVRLPDTDGMAILGHCLEHHRETEVILMTAYASVSAAVEAVKMGAYDYLAKPFEPDELLLKVSRALERRSLLARARAAETALRQLEGGRHLLGESAPMCEVRRLIDRIAELSVTVLITGESGTGKEVAARAIHDASTRHDKPFVAVNCGAIPGSLLESELFGHVKGAFTGAHADHKGLIEEAGGGTLVLDEIGDLPLDLQVKLNRALEERRYRRVGEARERPVNARVVAATHRDLEALARDGTFREDLYFRLAVYPIELPPLRARGGDIVLLANHFLKRAAERFDREVVGLSPDALRALSEYGWPGNVRELCHAVERGVILAESAEIRPADLPPNVVHRAKQTASGATVAEPDFGDLDYREAMGLARVRATRRYLEALLTTHDGNVTRAAEHAKVERESLHRLVRRVGLDAGGYRKR